MRTRAAAVALFFVLALPTIASATTWSPAEVVCPVCSATNHFDEIASYGSYIYSWPERCQLIFWPVTDSHSVWTCASCGYSAFLWDFAEPPPDKLDAIRKAIEGIRFDPALPYSRIPMSYRLAAAEKVYAVTGLDDESWCRLYRVLGYHLESEGDVEGAAAARRNALALAQKLLALPDKAPIRKELLVISGSMRSFLGDKEGAAKDFAEAATLTLQGPNGEEAADEDAYYSDLIALQQKSLAGDGECSPARFLPPPPRPWQKLERQLFRRSGQELGAERWARRIERSCAEPLLSGRIELAPALKPDKASLTIADVSKEIGPPDRVEDGAIGGEPIKRFFWGPRYLVAGAENEAPRAEGNDFVWQQLMLADEEQTIGGATYQTAHAHPATAELSVDGAPAGATVTLSREGGSAIEGALPFAKADLPPGTYRLMVAAEGHAPLTSEVVLEPGFATEVRARLRDQCWDRIAEQVFESSPEEMRSRVLAERGCSALQTRDEAPAALEDPAMTVAQAIAAHGKPTRVEEGIVEGRRVRRFFWGPYYLVAADQKSPPIAQGVDYLLETLTAEGGLTGESLSYRELPASKAAEGPRTSVEIEGWPEGALLEATGPTGKVFRGKLPWKAKGIPTGKYALRISAKGFPPADAEIVVEEGFAARLRIWLEREP